ncbi:MAG: pentapeptide repeat-containing protein, partial [Vicinamibacteria bacterium]|nr:pentapeptide repeat-containing protein [Vicinamibacteria bacterium]
MKKRPKSASGADPEDPDEGTRRELLALLAQGADGVERFNARYKEALALAPFRRARCAGLDLASARLVSMPEGRFTKASLQGASLDRQDFGRANFVEADLRNASLIGARLVRADFTRANLEGARLDGASLQGANLTDASLKDAVLEGTSHNEATVWPSSFKLPSGLRWTGDGPDPIALARIDRAKSRRKPVDLPQFMKLLGKSIEGPRLA